MPVVALLAWWIIGNISGMRRFHWFGITFPLAILLPLTLAVVVSGRLWAAWRGIASAWVRMLLSAALGLAWTYVSMGAWYLLFTFGYPDLGPEAARLDLYLGCLCWPLFLVYARLEGELVHWRIRKLQPLEDGSISARNSA
ncbi:MAG: hypothetical protein IPL96_15640 [Holophagaceae bacterium]|nr:hypothetical protein [Holophagaceae bacterium]